MKERKIATGGASPLTRVAIMLLMPMLVVAIIACDSGSSGGQSQQTTLPAQAARAPYQGIPEGKPKGLGSSVPDPKEVVEKTPAGQLPSFISQVKGAQQQTTEALYKGAAQYYDQFAYVPCYCGCAIYAHPHKSLAECFIKSKAADGSLEFTDHSVTCSQCQEAAQMTVDGMMKGTPLKDIRAAVFKQLNYTQIWTDTPPIP